MAVLKGNEELLAQLQYKAIVGEYMSNSALFFFSVEN